MNHDNTVMRVIRRDHNSWELAAAGQRHRASLAGRFVHAHPRPEDQPVVGDWVCCETGAAASDGLRISAVQERRNAFLRKVPISGGRRETANGIEGGRTEAQVLAANLDTAFVVVGADRDANPRRLERYLLMLAESRIPTVVVLNKCDLHPDGGLAVAARLEAALPPSRRGELPVLRVSARESSGLDALGPWLGPGKLVVFVGSSGAGKTSLLLALGAAAGQVAGLSGHNQKGRHTTTQRECFELADGSLVVDTPGIRELQLWCEAESVDDLFEDIVALAAGCRYPNCRHGSDEGCALQAAVAAGGLDPGRLAAWQRLRAEGQRLAQRKRERREGKPRGKAGPGIGRESPQAPGRYRTGVEDLD